MLAPVDESEWPLVTVNWVGSASDETINAFLAQLDGWLGRGERFGLLIDSRRAGGMSPEQRVLVIEHMKKQAQLTSRFLVQAVVLDSLLQRTLFFGINLIFPNPFPSKIFADPAVAKTWLSHVLATLPARHA